MELAQLLRPKTYGDIRVYGSTSTHQELISRYAQDAILEAMPFISGSISEYHVFLEKELRQVFGGLPEKGSKSSPDILLVHKNRKEVIMIEVRSGEIYTSWQGYIHDTRKRKRLLEKLGIEVIKGIGIFANGVVVGANRHARLHPHMASVDDLYHQVAVC